MFWNCHYIKLTYLIILKNSWKLEIKINENVSRIQFFFWILFTYISFEFIKFITLSIFEFGKYFIRSCNWKLTFDYGETEGMCNKWCTKCIKIILNILFLLYYFNKLCVLTRIITPRRPNDGIICFHFTHVFVSFQFS